MDNLAWSVLLVEEGMVRVMMVDSARRRRNEISQQLVDSS